MENPKNPTRPARLSRREKLFCYYYAHLGNPEDAAVRTGYPRDGHTAARLLIRDDIQRETERLREQCRREAEAAALAGLRRAALGSVDGAARLVLAGGELPPEERETLDLFCVAELKQGKGACEVRLLDRLKALGLLLDYSRSTREDGGDGSLLEALEKGARAVAEPGEGHEGRTV